MITIPKYITAIISKLEENGFEAFVVGGCVRDLFLEKEPKDWDVATNARPEDVMEIFPDSVYENEFGTVGVKVTKHEARNLPTGQAGTKHETEDDSENEIKEIVEVTTYRIESKYTDKRHPDEVRFAKTLEEDLSRRDFTINAMAFHITRNTKHETRNKYNSFEIVDLVGGKKDLENKIIRAVGDADERFNEDALRMMRAIRFACTLSENMKHKTGNMEQSAKIRVQNTWRIEGKTFEAIQKNASNLKYISRERIKDELVKIILSPIPAKGMELLHEAGLLQYVIPEIEVGYDVTQSHHHYYGPYNTVYKHLLASLEKCPSPKLEVRLASLLHDVGKPRSKRGEGENATFYNHEYIGAKMAREILTRLRFSRAVIDKVELLVKNHMFYYNVDEVGESGVRRTIRKVGLENINDLIDVRIADRLGSGVPKAVPYKLRHFKFMVEKLSKDPISVKQLKINGNDLMKELGLAPGPKVGAILDVLLAEVIDDPILNTKEKLLELATDLNKKDISSLRKLAKDKIEEEKKEKENEIKKKYKVA